MCPPYACSTGDVICSPRSSTRLYTRKAKTQIGDSTTMELRAGLRQEPAGPLPQGPGLAILYDIFGLKLIKVYSGSYSRQGRKFYDKSVTK